MTNEGGVVGTLGSVREVKEEVKPLVFRNIAIAKSHTEGKDFNGFSTSIEEIIGREQHFSSFVLNDAKKEKVFVVHDPFLRFLEYGNLSRLDGGIINTSFGLFFPGYFLSEDYTHVSEEIVATFKPNVHDVDNNNYNDIVSRYNQGVFVLEYKKLGLDSFLFNVYLNVLILGQNYYEKSHFTGRKAVVDFSNVSFDESFFGMLEYKGDSNGYDVVGFNEGFESLTFYPSHGRILKLGGR